ncbi:MAG: FtsX-like permease family protein, partial [Thermoanaerobaculia bacterium]|nr:FtsX-like permease family protein [Thermoanaerobaculia bacterium]
PGDPVGERIVLDGREVRVVGVVANVWMELLGGGDTRRPAVYVPHAQAGLRGMTLVVRSTEAAEAVPPAIRSALSEIDPRLPLNTVLSFDDYVGQFFGTQGLGPMLNAFGALSMLLAALGIYGVVAYSVASRTREIGLRMALGADRSRILRLIGKEGLQLLAAGLVVGAVLVAAVVSLVARMLSTVAPVSAAPMIVPIAILVAVAVLASYWPARRAARLEPVRALRVD